MKQILTVISLFVCVSLFAQTTTPRTGTGANNDNTFRALTLKYVAIADATGNDTSVLNLNAYTTLVSVALTDSVTIKLNPVTRCYFGDVVKVVVKAGAGGTKVKFLSTNVSGASGLSSVTVTSSKTWNIEFVFDGAKWVEVSRLQGT